MNHPCLQDLIQYALPANSPYYAALRGCLALRETVPLAERLAIGMNDPMFCWNVANAYVKADAPLPKNLEEYWFHEAYNYLRGSQSNLALAQAHALTFRANQPTYNLLKALLICRDCQVQEIERWTGLPGAAIRAFDQVFFNVRDRLDDRPYISALIYPNGRAATQKPGYLEQETEQQLLLRLACEYGYREVLYVAGITPKRLEGDPAAPAAQEVESALMENARTLVRQGAANAAEAPGLKRAQALLLVAKKTTEPPLYGDEVMGLGALSSSLGLSLVDELRKYKADAIAKTLDMPETATKGDGSRPFAFLNQEPEAPAKN